ncbi:MAG TPA: hypothetical protein VFZ37_18910 [Jiangellaceae bacterium]
MPPNTPGSGEIIGYGLLATGVAAGVLYLDGQPPRDIAIIAGAILALLLTLVVIAPRLRMPDKEDAVPPISPDPPPVTAREYVNPAPPERPATSRDFGLSTTRSASRGRRANRGRRRR